jgi:sulfur carrier protein
MITVNGEPAPSAPTITDLLVVRMGDPQPEGIAVAVNEEVVPRDDWPLRSLASGDAVEIVTAVAGG